MELADVVYLIPCQCDICWEALGKEHKDACNKRYTEKYAIAEYQWDQ